MLATICIPTYNQKPEYLLAAVGSALAQTVPCEIIIVDDGSDSPIESEHPQVKVITHEKNRGISAALNTGIAAMSTDWFCWLPSDDIFAPGKVERQRVALAETGQHCAFHQYYTFVNDYRSPSAVSKPWLWDGWINQRRQLGVGCAINGLTTMIHRDVFAAVGTFDESYRYGQDWEMWARITQAFEWLGMHDVLAYRRADGTNLTAKIDGNDELRAARDAEDERIRSRYGI